MTVSDETVLAGALAVRKRRMELNGTGHEFDPAIPPSDEQLDLTRCALTAALSDQAGGWQDISTARMDGTRIEYHNGREIDPVIGYCRWATWPEDTLEDWWDYEHDCEARPKFWRPEMPLPTAKPQPVANPTASDDLCKALTGIAAFNLSDNPEAQLQVYNAVRTLRLLDRAGIQAGITPAQPPSSTAGEAQSD